jgi:hypothetical protein
MLDLMLTYPNTLVGLVATAAASLFIVAWRLWGRH